MKILSQILTETANKRGSLEVMKDFRKVVASVQESEIMQNFWRKYQKDFDYASDILFEDTCNTIIKIFEQIEL